MTGDIDNPATRPGRPKARPGWVSGLRSSRANNMDLIRLVMAVGVIVSHAWPIVPLQGGPHPLGDEPLTVLTAGQFSIGSLSVHGFFILSGYLIAASWVHSPSLAVFARRRVMRIYPGFVVAMIVSLALGVLSGASPELDAKGVARRVILVAMLQPPVMPLAYANNPVPMNVNGSMWTIQYEMYCYVLVAALGVLIVRGRGLLILGGVLALAVAAAVIWKTDWEWVPGSWVILTARPAAWPRLATHFFAGTAFYIFRDYVPRHPAMALAALTAFVGSATLPPLMYVVSPFAMTYLVMWLAFDNRVRVHHFGKYGDFSYGTYLYSFPIQQILVYYGVTTSVWSSIALTTPLSLLAGVLSWHLVEKRFAHYRVSGRRPDVTNASAATAVAAAA